MTSRALIIAMVVVGLLAWTLPGCRQEAQETTAVAVDEPPPPEGGRGPDAEAPAALEAATETAQESASEEQQASAPPARPAVINTDVDYDRYYDSMELDRLRGIMRYGSAEQKAQARQVLIDLMLHSTISMVRQQCAAILGMVPEGAEMALAQAAENDPESDVRERAIASLAQAPPSDRLLKLLARLQHANDAAVRSAALMAEMKVRLENADQLLTTQWLAKMLAQRRDDATAQLQMQLLQHGPGNLPRVIEVLETAEDPVARSAAACVIALMCAGTNPQQERFAALALTIKKEGIPEPGPANLAGVKPLERALATDPDYRVRAMAAQGLGYLGQESSAPILGRALHDESEEVRWWAALALSGVPGERALDDLAYAATKDPSERVRAAAVEALGWIESDRVVLPLARATLDHSAAVRQAAATKLGGFKHPAAREALLMLFDDENEDVRWAAVLSVGKLRDPETVEALTRALRDPSPMVANAAERALQRMGFAQRRFGTRGEEM